MGDLSVFFACNGALDTAGMDRYAELDFDAARQCSGVYLTVACEMLLDESHHLGGQLVRAFRSAMARK